MGKLVSSPASTKQSDTASEIVLFPLPQKSWTRLLVFGIISISLLSLGFILGRQQKQSPSPPAETQLIPEQLLTVETLTLTPVSSYTLSRRYTGETATVRESLLGFERGGKVVKLTVEEGAAIRQWQLIAQLDVSRLETQKLNLEAQKAEAEAILAELKTGARTEEIESAQANVQQLQERLSLEETKLKRREYLYQEGAISEEQLDEVSFTRNVLLAQKQEAQSYLDQLLAGTRVEKIQAQQAVIQQLHTRLKELNLEISKSWITSPYNGIISQRFIDEGTVVSTGQSIVKLVETGQLEVRVGIPVEKVNALTKNSAYPIEINQEIYSATLSAILPEVNPKTRTQTLIFTLDTPQQVEIASGAIANLILDETVTESGFWLPTTALLRGERGLWSCYAVMETEAQIAIVEARDLEVLQTESNRVFVRGTLQAGDQIIITGTQRIVPGQMVRL